MFVGLAGLALLAAGLSEASAWTKVHDERLPGELRVVNEGLTHGESVAKMKSCFCVHS